MLWMRSVAFLLLLALATNASHADESGTPPDDACAKTLERYGGSGFKVTWRDIDGSRVFGLEFGRAMIGLVRFTKQQNEPKTTPQWRPASDGALQGEERNVLGWKIFVTLSPQTKARAKDFKRGAEQCLGGAYQLPRPRKQK